MTPSIAVSTYLQQVRRRVGEVWISTGGKSPSLNNIPDFEKLVAAANKLDGLSPDTSAYVATVLKSLLRRAGCVDEKTFFGNEWKLKRH